MDYLEQKGSNRLTGRYSHGRLPHLRSQGRTYFVTFRLYGTLPLAIVEEYVQQLRELERKAREGSLTVAEESIRSRLFFKQLEACLDSGNGHCWLKNPAIAELLVEAIRAFDGVRYELGSWVIMPNHVHALVRPLGTHLLDKIIHSWKLYTGRTANQLLNRTRQPFWSREYYDRIVRNDEERARISSYILNNPRKAGLCADPAEWPWRSR